MSTPSSAATRRRFLPHPRAGPGGDGALPDAQRRVGDEQVLGDVVGDAEAGAARAGAGGGVRAEALGLEPGRAVGVGAGAGVEHPQQVRQGRERPDGAAAAGGATALLQGDGGGQAGDLADLRRAGLLQEPAGVRGDGLEVAALRLGVERAEGEARLAGAGDAGEGHQRVAGDVHVDVAQVVLAGPAHVDEAVVQEVRARSGSGDRRHGWPPTHRRPVGEQPGTPATRTARRARGRARARRRCARAACRAGRRARRPRRSGSA